MDGPDAGSKSKQSLLYVLAALKLDSRTDAGIGSMSKADAQTVIDAAWALLETATSPSTESPDSNSLVRPSNYTLRRLAIDIAIHHDILPTSFLLVGVKIEDSSTNRWSGGFADIFRGTVGDTKVAVKRLRTFLSISENIRDQVKQSFYRECLLWKALRHPNIVPFLGIAEDIFENNVCLVIPWMENGRIGDYMKNLSGSFRLVGSAYTSEVNRWLYQISKGLEYLHSEHVVHGDLHGGNILVDGQGNICLTDFGLSVTSDGTPYANNSAHGGGAVRWTAPELIEPEDFGLASRRPTFQSDVYAFGCVCYEIYSGRRPFAWLEQEYQVITAVMKNVRPPRPSLPNGEDVSEAAWSLMAVSWAHQPSERPRMSVIVKFLGLLTGALAWDSRNPFFNEHTSLARFMDDSSHFDDSPSSSSLTLSEEVLQRPKADIERTSDLDEKGDEEGGVLPSVDRYIPPIGVVRVWIQKAIYVKGNEAKGGNPYARLRLHGLTLGRTDVIENTLSPVWNQICYVPVHSSNEVVLLECMESHTNSKDQLVGYVDLKVSDLAHPWRVDQSEAMYISTGKKLREESFKLDKGAYKGMIYFGVEFSPIISVGPETPLWTATIAGMPDADKKRDELLELQSGITIFRISSGQLYKKARLQVLLDNAQWPAFSTQRSLGTRVQWETIGEAFVKELDFCRVMVRLDSANKGEKENIIAEWKGDMKTFLSRTMYGPVSFHLEHRDTEGQQSLVTVETRYMPVPVQLEPKESLTDQGLMQVSLLSGEDLHGIDRTGKSDPFVVFTLNGRRVFKSQTMKKTLYPEWSESFEVSVPSMSDAKFALEVFDWNQWESSKTLGSASISLFGVEPFETRDTTIPLTLDGRHVGRVHIRLLFRPEYITKEGERTSSFSSASRVITQIGTLFKK